MVFVIKDKRIHNSNTRVMFEVQYIYKLVEQIEKIISNGIKNAFTLNTIINVIKFSAKTKQTILFTFKVADNKPVINICLLDPTFPNGKVDIDILDLSCFKVIYNLMQSYVKNLISIDLKTKSLLSNDMIISRLDNIEKDIIFSVNEMNKITEDVKNIAKNQRSLVPIPFTKKEDFDIKNLDSVLGDQTALNQSESIDEFDEFSEETEPSEDQQMFTNELIKTNYFEDVRLPDIPEEDDDKPKKTKRKINQPLLSSFLNFDISRLKEWSTSFIHTNEKSAPDLFAPFDVIMKIGSISEEEMKQYTCEYGYYYIQYALIHILKRSIKDYLENNISYPTSSISPIMFSKRFVPGTGLYSLGKELVTMFLSYSFIVNNIMKTIDTHTDGISRFSEYEKVWYTIKLLFTPFIFSIELHDGLKDEILAEFRKCESSGFFNSMKEEYLNITHGGKINVSIEIFDKYIDKYISILKNVQSATFNTKENTSKYFTNNKIPIPLKKILNTEDIQKEVLCVRESDAKNLQKEEKLVPKGIKKETQIISSGDVALDTFLKIIKKYVTADIIKDIKKTCKDFKSLPAIFQSKDMPSEAFKIKRIMDLYPEEYNATKILRMAKLLEEDTTVTESRVLQDEAVNDITDEFGLDGTNVQDLLNI